LAASRTWDAAFFSEIPNAPGLHVRDPYQPQRFSGEDSLVSCLWQLTLGADRGRVLALIMKEAAILLAVGLAIGAGLSLPSTLAAASLLFGLNPHDPATMAMAAISLAVVAAAACYLPAFRAARIAPTEALREE